MSRGGKSEVDFLRQKISVIEAAPPSLSARLSARANLASTSRVKLGENLGLDLVLQGGLCRGALHEIAPARCGDGAAASGFALALSARFAAKTHAHIIWIVEESAEWETGAPYGPGLALHGVDPARLLLVHALDAKESLWSMEEALKCRAAAVIGEIWSLEKAYGLAASRRLALAARKSGTPGLLLAAGMARGARKLSTSAQTRFEVFSRAGLHAPAARGSPLPGLPCWSIRIVKARAGPDRAGFDPDAVFSLLWDHEEACFRDAFPLPLSAHARDRSGPPVDAGARRAESA